MKNLRLSLFVIFVVALLGAGCVSFNVGKPLVREVPGSNVPFKGKWSPLQVRPSGLRDVAVSVVPDVRGSEAEEKAWKERNPTSAWNGYYMSSGIKSGDIEVSLKPRISGTFSMEREIPTYRVVVQKSVSFGFFPFEAEFHPGDDALNPLGRGGNLSNLEWNKLVLSVPFATVRALLYEPFDWRDRAFECHTHAFDESSPNWSVVVSSFPDIYLPKQESLPTKLVDMGPYLPQRTVRVPRFCYTLTHAALFGLHKYRKIRVETVDLPRKESAGEVKFDDAYVSMNFAGEVELSIPSMNSEVISLPMCRSTIRPYILP